MKIKETDKQTQPALSVWLLWWIWKERNDIIMNKTLMIRRTPNSWMKCIEYKWPHDQQWINRYYDKQEDPIKFINNITLYHTG